MSFASIASVKENDSCGSPVIASGLLVEPGVSGLVVAGVHACVIVSGLYWKMMTFGIGNGNVSENSISAPRRYLLAITRAFRAAPRRTSRRHMRALRRL